MTTSGRNDYSVCTTWFIFKNDAYLVHVYRDRLEYPELRRKAFILETPFEVDGDDARDIAALRALSIS